MASANCGDMPMENTMQADAVPPAYPYPHAVEDRTIIKDHKKLKHKMKADP